MAERKKVLIGSPIHQKPQILREFLASLKRLKQDEIQIDYFFIDDNESEESKRLLQEFAIIEETVAIHENDRVEEYECNEERHVWREQLIWKVARFKNVMIELAKEYQYDYLFLIDSDLLLHPNTIEHLVRTGKEIISEVFWTKWQPDSYPQPQVWLTDQYTQYHQARHEPLTDEEKWKRHQQFLDHLKQPGVYEVGGLGACTLISRKALLAGVNFNEIRNIMLWGEDRHFCIRAAALGFELNVDTHYPAFHIYRETDLQAVPAYLQENEEREYANWKFAIGQAVQKGMELLGDFEYDRKEQPNWQPYFSDMLQRDLLAQSQNEYAHNLAVRLSVKAKVSDPFITQLDPQQGTATVKFSLRNDGMENGKSFCEQYRVQAQLVRGDDGKWRIDLFQVQEQQPVFPVPLVRFAKDRHNKLTLSMIVKNEADRYLREVLREHRQYIDEAVIIDDGSIDRTMEIVQEMLQDIPLHIVQNPVSKFSNEYQLRSQQWLETLKTNPDWILNLDADEMFETRFRQEVRNLINQQKFDVCCFRLYDMWDETQYREDAFWRAHQSYRPFLVRYQPEFPYRWKETPQHCGRFPENIMELPAAGASLRLKHFGWARAEDRAAKYNRYLELDPEAKYGWKEQYDSILDPHPHLVKWEE